MRSIGDTKHVQPCFIKKISFDFFNFQIDFKESHETILMKHRKYIYVFVGVYNGELKNGILFHKLRNIFVLKINFFGMIQWIMTFFAR